jgi:hypothetical protein
MVELQVSFALILLCIISGWLPPYATARLQVSGFCLLWLRLFEDYTNANDASDFNYSQITYVFFPKT